MPIKKNRKCTVEGCGKPHKAKGFCSRHYLLYLANSHEKCTKCKKEKENKNILLCNKCISEKNRKLKKNKIENEKINMKLLDEILNVFFRFDMDTYYDKEWYKEELDLSRYDEQLLWEIKYYQKTGKVWKDMYETADGYD